MIEVDKDGNVLLSNGKIVNTKQYTSSFERCYIVSFETKDDTNTEGWVNIELYFNCSGTPLETSVHWFTELGDIFTEWDEGMFSMYSERDVIMSVVQDSEDISKIVLVDCCYPYIIEERRKLVSSKTI